MEVHGSLSVDLCNVYNFGNVYNWLYYFICSSDGMYFGFLGISL